jgi:molybdopterin adenylyltransferase
MRREIKFNFWRSDMNGKVAFINFTGDRKEPKEQIGSGLLIAGAGLQGDAYNKPPHRQISLISVELLKEQAQCPRAGKEPEFTAGPGSFKETLTTEGLDLALVRTGDVLKIGESAKIRISEKGMTCWEYCPWGRLEGECPLPKHFLFAEVIEGGVVKTGDIVG